MIGRILVPLAGAWTGHELDNLDNLNSIAFPFARGTVFTLVRAVLPVGVLSLDAMIEALPFLVPMATVVGLKYALRYRAPGDFGFHLAPRY